MPILTAAFLALTATQTPAEPSKLSRRELGDLAIKAREVLRKHCSECHGQRAGSDHLDILSHPRLIAGAPNPIPFVSRERSQILELVKDGSMPPGGRDRPSDEEIATLQQWATEGAPSFPRAFDDRTTLKVMLDDISTMREKDPKAVPYLRYVSLAHLIRDGEPVVGALGQLERQLQQGFLRSTSVVRFSKLGAKLLAVPVDDSATLFRIDIRLLGWETPDLFDQMDGQKVSGVAPVVPYDLILLEYPDGFRLPAGDLQAPLQAYLDATRQLRPVPFVKGDWLAAALGNGRPLSAELKALVELGEALGRQAPPTQGPTPRPFADAQPLRLTPTGLPGSLPLPPFGAIYSGDIVFDTIPPKPGAPPTDESRLSAAVTVMSGAQAMMVAKNTPFRLRVNGDAREDLRVIVLQVLADGDTRIPSINGGNLIRKGETRHLTPAGAGAFQIPSLLTGGEDETTHFVIIASVDELDLPTVIRSRHDPNPIYRFICRRRDGTEWPDQARIIRRVLPLTVTAR